jgi:hypothetical protein
VVAEQQSSIQSPVEATTAPVDLNSPNQAPRNDIVNGLGLIANDGSLGNESQSITGNTLKLLQSNTGDGISINSKSESGDFSFGLKNPEGDKKESGEAKPGNGPGKGQGQAKGDNQETRQKLQLGNTANIQSLNDSINQQKVASQQGQGGQGGFGGGQFGGQGGQGGFGGGQFGGQQGFVQQGGRGFGSGQGGFGGGQFGNNPGGQQGGQGGFGGGQFGGGGGQQGFVQGRGLWGGQGGFGGGFGQQGQNQQGGQGGFGGGQFGGTSFNPPMNPNGLPGPQAAGGSSLQSHTVRNRTQMQSGVQKDSTVIQDEPTGQPQTTTAGVPILNKIPFQQLAQQDGRNDELLGTAANRPPVGGLSLEFELPSTGRKLVFSKTGGDPKLGLTIRPKETIRSALNLTWAAVWIGIGIGIIATYRNKSAIGMARYTFAAIALLSVLGFIVLPAPLNSCAFATFLIAALIVAWICRRPSTAAV